MSWRYRCYGLTIDSELPLRSLPVSEMAAEPDVDVVLGPVPTAIAGTRIDARSVIAGDMALIVTASARFLVTAERIAVEPITADACDHLVTGLALGTALVLRGQPCLHAGAVAFGDSAVAIGGPNGAGKSTMAAELVVSGGATLISDDACALTLDAGRAQVMNGPGWSKVTREFLALHDLAPVAAGHAPGPAERERFFLPLPRAEDRRRPLVAFYRLARGETGAVRQAYGLSAARGLVAAAHGAALIGRSCGARSWLTTHLTAVATVPVFDVPVPEGLDRLGPTAAALAEHARSLRPEAHNEVSNV